MSIPIYCINLEKSLERKKNIIDNWINNFGFNIIFWKAIDQHESFIKTHDKKSNYLPNRLIKNTELAYIYSYVNLLKHILSLNIDEVIIMEDDIFPNPIFNCINTDIPSIFFDYIYQCKKEFPSLQMLLMHKVAFDDQFKIRKELSYCYSLFEFPWGAQMNYYTRDGIKKILQYLQTFKIIVDHYHAMKNLHNFSALTKTPLAFHFECYSCNKPSNFINSQIR